MRDPDATRARILEAASDEFAEYGIAGARVNRIAVRARANKERIYANFSDKQGLFGAVMVRALIDIAEAVRLDPTDLPGYVGHSFDYFADHPRLARLATWGRLEQKEAPVGEDDPRIAIYAGKIAAIRAAQEAGVVDPAWEPVALITVLLALSAAWATAPTELHHLAGAAGIGRDAQRSAAVRAAGLVVSAGAGPVLLDGD